MADPAFNGSREGQQRRYRQPGNRNRRRDLLASHGRSKALHSLCPMARLVGSTLAVEITAAIISHRVVILKLCIASTRLRHWTLLRVHSSLNVAVTNVLLRFP